MGQGEFSPRPWGCTVQGSAVSRGEAILPTPVGLYPHHRRRKMTELHSPHARGAVPVPEFMNWGPLTFSPRPWGCTARTRLMSDVPCILPTPVGLYPTSLPRQIRVSNSPHARGAVPERKMPNAITRKFSPRPWGCTNAVTWL